MGETIYPHKCFYTNIVQVVPTVVVLAANPLHSAGLHTVALDIQTSDILSILFGATAVEFVVAELATCSLYQILFLFDWN